MYKYNLPEIDFLKSEEVLKHLNFFKGENLKVEYKNTFKENGLEKIKSFNPKKFYEKIKSFDIFDICLVDNEVQIFSVDSWIYLNIA